MKTIFDQEKWSATQAALHIFCDVRLGSEDVAMRQLKIALAAWLADSDRLNRAFPIKNPDGLKRLTTFATKAEATWGAGFATLELHPAIWTWFVASKCWRSSPKGYWRDFHRWSADHAAQGRIVLVQRRISPNKTWSTPTLTTIGEAGMDFGVQPTVLVFRKFQTRKATSEWRTVFHALGTDTSVQTLCAKAQGHTW